MTHTRTSARFKSMLALLATASATALLALPTDAEAATRMRCSHQLPPAHHIAKVVERWAAEVRTLSDGDLDVQVFGSDSLIKANENILAVAKGDIECAFSLNFQWGKTLPLMNVTVGPYTMSSIEAWKKWPTSEAAARVVFGPRRSLFPLPAHIEVAQGEETERPGFQSVRSVS